MNPELPLNQDQSVSVGGSITNGVILTGDGNTAFIQNQQTSLPPVKSINIQNELANLREVISNLETDDQYKIKRAFEDAEEELKKAEPDKDEVG